MKDTPAALILICLMTLGAVRIQPIEAQYQCDITINADGSISPSTAPIRQDGDRYILTSDVIGGVFVMRSSITVDGNGHTVEGEVGGIILKNVKNLTVKNFIIKGGQYGVDLSECSYVTVVNNTIMRTSFFIANEGLGGISVRGGHYNIIVGNRLENNFYGMYLMVANSTIIENTIINNSVGIYLQDSSNNTMYHNNFINNGMNVMYRSQISSRLLNTWDGGPSSGGNYWSDYDGPDANGDGIGGSPYIIDSNNQDRYPLMKPWEPDNAPPRSFILSPENKTYNDSNVILVFSTSEPASKISYSIDGQDSVAITGNTTLSKLRNGSHNLKVYATDKAGNTGVSEIVYFTVDAPEPFPLAPVVVASALSVVIIGVWFLVYFKRRKR
ncbi:hypothetical protein G4O51_03770 [Candidatus Bathyarchaeota archaeon A05DMB-2]|jgi:parallel beta-helix repeat protein|nr:hypothetical protein [Candidatus Bathyarchaeota archaeon A05DMB-2]